MSPLLYQLSYTANRCIRPPRPAKTGAFPVGLQSFQDLMNSLPGEMLYQPGEELSSRGLVNQ